MKLKRIAPDDYWMFAANIAVSAIIFVGVYLMNMKEIGRGSQPGFALLFALMVTGMYQACFLMFAEIGSKKIQWAVLAVFGFLASASLIHIVRL